VKQLDQLRKHFDSGESLTVGAALTKFGIYALSQRCGDLAAQGYPLDKDWLALPSGKRVRQYKKLVWPT